MTQWVKGQKVRLKTDTTREVFEIEAASEYEDMVEVAGIWIYTDLLEGV